MFGPKVGCTFLVALCTLVHLKACVRTSHYRFGGKTQLPGFESERESIVMAWQLFSSFEIPGITAKPLLSVLQG